MNKILVTYLSFALCLSAAGSPAAPEGDPCDAPVSSKSFFGSWSATGEWRAPVLLLKLESDDEGLLIASESRPGAENRTWVGELIDFRQESPFGVVVRFESKAKDGGVIALLLARGDCSSPPVMLFASLKADDTNSDFFGPFQTDTGLNLFFPEHMIVMHRGASALDAMQKSLDSVRKELKKHGG